MTFDELWPLLPIPGEYDAMDECDRNRWRGVIEQAFEAGKKSVWAGLSRWDGLPPAATDTVWIEPAYAVKL